MSNLIENIPYELFSYIGGGIFLFIILYKFFPKLFVKVHKPIFFTIGILSLSLGYVGIVVGVARKEKDMIMSRLRGSVITSGCLPWASAVEISHHRARRMARWPSRYGVAWA